MAHVGKRHAFGCVHTIDPGENGHKFRAADGLARLEGAVAAAGNGPDVGQCADCDRVPLAGRNVTEIVAAAVILLVRLLGHELVEQLSRLGARERTGRRKVGRTAAGNISIVAGRIQQAGRLRRLRAGAAAVVIAAVIVTVIAAAVIAHLGDVLFQQRHGLLERDGAAVVERTDDRHNVLQVHICRGNELGQELRDLIVREDAARDARQNGVDAGLRHAESLQNLGKRLLGRLTVRAAGGNVADDLAEVDVHRVAGDGDDAVHVVVVAGNILEQIAHIHVHDTVDEVAVAGDVIDEVIDVHADNAVDEVIAVDDTELVENVREDRIIVHERGRRRVGRILVDGQRGSSGFHELDRGAVADGLITVERANHGRHAGKIKRAGLGELGGKGLRIVCGQILLCDAGDDHVRLAVRDAGGLADVRQDRARIFAVEVIRLGVRDGCAEVDVDDVAADGHDAVRIVAAAGNIVKQVAGLDADDAVDKVAVADDVIDEVVDVHAHNAVNEVIPVDNVDAVQDVRERGNIALALQGLDAKRRRNGHGCVAKQLRRRADIEQAAVRQAAEQSRDVRQADFSGRGKLIDHGRCLIVAERAGRDGVDDAAALDLGHAGVREQLGQERAGGLTARVLLLRILESKAEVDIDAVIDHGHDAVRVITVTGDVLEQIADRHAHDAVGEIAVAADMVDQIFDVHADDAVDKVIVVGDADLAQDLAEQTVVQLAIGRVGCAALRFRVCRESRDCSEAECQHEGQYQTQRLAHFFHKILPPLSSR